jgi:hypothetical protein
MTRVAFLSELSRDDVRARIRAFADSYKDDWQGPNVPAQSKVLGFRVSLCLA